MPILSLRSLVIAQHDMRLNCIIGLIMAYALFCCVWFEYFETCQSIRTGSFFTLFRFLLSFLLLIAYIVLLL